MSSGFPRAIKIPPATPGRPWIALAALLLVISIGSWLYLVITLGIEGSVCFDVKRLPETQPGCDREHLRVAEAWRLVILIAAISAAVMVFVGVLEGLERRRFAYGRRQPLRILFLVNPAGMLGYLVGRIVGRLLPPFDDFDEPRNRP
jgi:hypothetical protein